METPETKKRTETKRTVWSDITAERIREVAAEHGNRRDIGIALGYQGDAPDKAVGNLLTTRPDLRPHYEAGRADYKAAHPDVAVQTGTGTGSIGDAILNRSLEELEEIASRLGTLRKMASEFGYSDPSGFRYFIKSRPHIVEAIERGQASYKARKAGNDTMTESEEATERPSAELPTPETHATESAELEASISPESVEEPRPLEEPPATEHHAIATAEQETTLSPESDAIKDRDESENEDTPRFETAEERSLPLNVCPDCKFPYGTYGEAVKCFEQHRNRSAAEYYESIKTGWLPESLQPTPSSIEMEIDESDIKPETAKATAEFVTGLMEERNVIGRPLLPSDVPMEAVVQGFRPNSASVNRTYITLQNGSQLLVAFEGNFLELSDRDREVVTHVSRLMQQYEDGRLSVAGHDDKPRKLGQRVKDAVLALFG